jgi:hypothetical protein
VVAIPPNRALQVEEFIPDTTPPQLSSYSINMGQAHLVSADASIGRALGYVHTLVNSSICSRRTYSSRSQWSCPRSTSRK